MASAEDHRQLWDRNNTEQDGLIYGSELDERLIQVTVCLKDNLKLDDVWARLEELSVLKPTDIETIQHGKARPHQVEELLWFIRKGCRWQYHALMRAMALTGQRNLIPGADSKIYLPEEERNSSVLKGQSDPSPCSGIETKVYEEGAPPKHLPTSLVKMIRDHCKYNVDHLMKTPLFDFEGDSNDDITDISKVFVPVDLKVKDTLKELAAIPTKDILEQWDDKEPPRVVRLDGDPGDGKSSLMKDIARSLSAEFFKLTDEELTLKCPRWTTIVYLSARKITGTVEEALWNELGCKKSDADTLMKHVETGEGTAVFMDSLDEVRDRKVLEKIKHYVHQCKMKGGPTVFIAARTGLCRIDAVDIDRIIMLQGFTEGQGLDYVKLYTETCQVPQQPEQPPLMEYVTQYRAELKSVLTNPLRLYIFCSLAVRGELDLNNQRGFNIPLLFGPLERYLLRRSLLKEGEGGEVSDDQRMDFYRLAMHGLLNGLREFPESLLVKFNIAKAYYIFLRRSSRRGADAVPVAYYSFGHEILYEYFASQYIQSLSTDQKKSLFLTICSNEQHRNVQYIIFQMLLEEWETQKDLIVSMIRCMLILQFTTQDNVKGKFIDLMDLRNIVMNNSSLEVLPDEKHGSSITNSAKIWEEVNDAFEKNAHRLQECGWFVYIHVNNTVDHVIRCLQASSAHQQEILFESTICHMLPCKWKSEYMESFLRGPAKWGDLDMFPDGIHFMFATRPREAHKMLSQYKKKHPQEIVSKVKITFNKCGALGTAPENAWTTDEWYGLTQELETANEISFEMSWGMSHPLTGMLRNFVENMAHLQQRVTIRVGRGIVPLHELLWSLFKCKQIPNLALELNGPSVIVPSGQDEVMLRAKRDRACEIVMANSVLNIPALRSPFWVTENGEKYVWSDNK